MSETVHHIGSILLRHRQYIRSDAWAGLPELTNKSGEHCRDSVRELVNEGSPTLSGHSVRDSGLVVCDVCVCLAAIEGFH
jgi:hypothetical protein